MNLYAIDYGPVNTEHDHTTYVIAPSAKTALMIHKWNKPNHPLWVIRQFRIVAANVTEDQIVRACKDSEVADGTGHRR